MSYPPPPPPAPAALAPPPPPPTQCTGGAGLASEFSSKVKITEAVEVDEEKLAAVLAAPRIVRGFKCKRCEKLIPELDFSSHHTSHSNLILPFLFLGAERNSKNLKELTIRTQVSFILNVTWEAADHHPELFTYKRLLISDYKDQRIADFFDEAFEFIEGARFQGKKVFVHCVQGISRSSTVVISYLMRYKRWTMQRALKHVKTVRPIVNPNPGFLEQLKELELRLGLHTDNLDHIVDEEEQHAVKYWEDLTNQSDPVTVDLSAVTAVPADPSE
jgi:hypothetical protein